MVLVFQIEFAKLGNRLDDNSGVARFIAHEDSLPARCLEAIVADYNSVIVLDLP